jgi:hypothetical protein
LSALRPYKVGLRVYIEEIKNIDEYDIGPTRKIYIEGALRTSMKTPGFGTWDFDVDVIGNNGNMIPIWEKKQAVHCTMIPPIYVYGKA